jgi:cell division protein FtsL
MNKKKLSVDGFTPRRQSTSGLRENKNRSQTSMSTSLRRNIGKPPVDNHDKTINIKFDIKSSLSEIDRLQEKSADVSKKLEKINKKRLQKGKKPLSKSAYKFRKIRKIIFSILIVAVLAFVVVNGYRILNTVNKTFNGNFLGIFQYKHR